MTTTKIPFPALSGAYRSVYRPQAALYQGPDTPSFKSGRRYEHWVANDFTMIRGHDGLWHAYGITHPKPPDFTDAFHYGNDVHEAEFQLFHCTFSGSLAELYNGGRFEERDQILRPADRPGERPECWAPCIYGKDRRYYMYYSPETLHVALSEDLTHFVPQPKGLFKGPYNLRDPFVFEHEGTYVMVYTYDHLYYRTSENLMDWSDEAVFQENPYGGNSMLESPFVFRRGDLYYLVWCLYDGWNGCYDERTFVFASDDPFAFSGKAPVAMLRGHAPEIYEEDGQYYIFSVFHPENGLNMAKLAWD